MNVLIEEQDAFFRQGFDIILKETLGKIISQDITIRHDYNSENINWSDLLVLSLSPGEQFVCTPELLCKTHGTIIGIVDQDMKYSGNVTSCLDKIYFVPRNATVEYVKGILLDSLQSILLANDGMRPKSCFRCKKKTVSPRQSYIIRGLMNGETAEEIAEAMNISSKTVYAHKYLVMTKFDLQSDYHLLRLSNKLRDKQHPLFMNMSRTASEEMYSDLSFN